ncbi:MAG: hypothetical protein IPL32_03685 [Chloracidobacterium sp.]|nr:hypothetical protein [Chloracidobacterium sp.]
MEELEHDFLLYLLVAGGILVGGIIVAFGGWRLWPRFKPRRPAKPDFRPVSPAPIPHRPIPKPETISQIDNVLTLIERDLWDAGSIPTQSKHGEEILERILARLNQIRLKTSRSLNREFKSPPAFGELIVTPSWSPSSVQNTPSPPVPTFAEEFVEMYNRARENKEERNLFWGKFHVIQIGNRNASDQRLGRTTEADFRRTDVGDFLAVQNAEAGTYLVVPHFTLVIDDTSYRYGGVAAAFECDFTPGASHQQFQVFTPAEFANVGDTWIPKNPGKLSLRDY